MENRCASGAVPVTPASTDFTPMNTSTTASPVEPSGIRSTRPATRRNSRWKPSKENMPAQNARYAPPATAADTENKPRTAAVNTAATGAAPGLPSTAGSVAASLWSGSGRLRRRAAWRYVAGCFAVAAVLPLCLLTGSLGAVSLVLIAVGAPTLGALYTRTESFSIAFGLLGAFCFVMFWLTRLLRRQEEFPTRAGSPARTSRSAP